MGAVAMALGQSSGANAYSLAVGAVFQLDSSSQKLTSTTGFLITGAYHFNANSQQMGGLNTDSSIDLSYGSFSGHSNHLTQYSALLTIREPVGGNQMGAHVRSSTVPYYGLGIGIVHNSLSASTTIAGQSGGPSTNVNLGGNDNNFAAKALIGMRMSSALFIEGSYNYNGSVHGARVDNIAVSIGYRF